MITQVTENKPYLDQKVTGFLEKIAPIKVESFLIPIFYLNQTWKVIPTLNC